MTHVEHIKAAAIALAEREDGAGEAARQMLRIAAYAREQDVDLWAEMTADTVADEAIFRSFDAESACEGDWSIENIVAITVQLLQYGLAIAGLLPAAGAAEGAIAILVELVAAVDGE